jgi:hypothetical protein
MTCVLFYLLRVYRGLRQSELKKSGLHNKASSICRSLLEEAPVASLLPKNMQDSQTPLGRLLVNVFIISVV